MVDLRPPWPSSSTAKTVPRGKLESGTLLLLIAGLECRMATGLRPKSWRGNAIHG